MTQLHLFPALEIPECCPTCGRELNWLYSPARPGPPWDEVATDWGHGAEWAVCQWCSPRTVRAVRPCAPPPARAA